MPKLKLTHPEFRHVPSAICGTGSIRALAGLEHDGTVFLVSDQPAVVDLVNAALQRSGSSLQRTNSLRKPPGEPTVESIRAAAEFLRSIQFQRVVAVGGGSVLDWARLAWAHGAGLLDLDSGAAADLPAGAGRPEFWLVPTTCATGAEAADVAVFINRAGEKKAVVARVFLADKVILDGRFLETLAPAQVAASLCDALSHAIEAGVSLVPIALAKEAALSALRLIIDTFPQPASGSQRDRFMEASFLGGVAAANCSVGIIHAFAHSAGAGGLAHGLANACALRTGIEFNAHTPQMLALLKKSGLQTHDRLIAAIEPILDHALTDIARHPVARRLQDREYQQSVAARMATDVTIRSNPRRATHAELETFVRSVAERVSR